MGATFAGQPKKTYVFVPPGIADDKDSETIACAAFGKRQATAQSGHEKARSPNLTPPHMLDVRRSQEAVFT